MCSRDDEAQVAIVVTTVGIEAAAVTEVKSTEKGAEAGEVGIAILAAVVMVIAAMVVAVMAEVVMGTAVRTGIPLKVPETTTSAEVGVGTEAGVDAMTDAALKDVGQRNLQVIDHAVSQYKDHRREQACRHLRHSHNNVGHRTMI